jgi:hypothetical protein
MSWLGLASFGFLLGMRHAVEADHLAAVASLSARSTSLGQAIRLGTVWGLGHTLTLFVVGAVVLAADSVVPERLAQGLELAVGFMLVGLGLDVLRRLVRDRVHVHVHEHAEGVTHVHAHSHPETKEDGHRHGHGFPGRALAVGFMHGMAGSAALILLTTVQAPTVGSGLLYIGIFGAGSIFGMAVLSVVISIPLRYSGRSKSKAMAWIHQGLQGTIGIATVVIGSVLIIELTGN